LGGTEQLIALAEIVYTATARPGVGQVSFTLEGEPIEIPRGDGSLTSDAVTRGDYRELAPFDE
jgi:spore germination protein GerM